jgi:prepilin-type N-terminal cleavage/methylation domain-containing protein
MRRLPNENPPPGSSARNNAGSARATGRTLRRAGFTLFELMIASILLGTVLMTAIPTLGWINRNSLAAERQQVAILGVGNLMERLTARPWDEITAEAMAGVPMPDDLSRQLPGAELRIFVVTPAEDLSARRLTIELRWEGSSAGTQSPPVRLTAWVYRHDRGAS